MRLDIFTQRFYAHNKNSAYLSVYDFFTHKAHNLKIEDDESVAALSSNMNDPSQLFYFVVDRDGEVTVKLFQLSPLD